MTKRELDVTLNFDYREPLLRPLIYDYRGVYKLTPVAPLCHLNYLWKFHDTKSFIKLFPMAILPKTFLFNSLYKWTYSKREDAKKVFFFYVARPLPTPQPPLSHQATKKRTIFCGFPKCLSFLADKKQNKNSVKLCFCFLMWYNLK